MNAKNSEANTTQVGGAHYRTEYQHWDLVWDTGMGYFPGQITKYVSRHSKKNGLQDVRKAAHFAAKYAELLGADITDMAMPKTGFSRTEILINRYRLANPHLDSTELSIIAMMAHAHDHNTLVHVVKLIADMTGAYPTAGYVNQGD